MAVIPGITARAALLGAAAFALLSLWSPEPARADVGEVVAVDDALRETVSRVQEVTDRGSAAVGAVEPIVGEVVAEPQKVIDAVATTPPAVEELVPPAVAPSPAGNLPAEKRSERQAVRTDRREVTTRRDAPAPIRAFVRRVPVDARAAGTGIAPAGSSGTRAGGVEHDRRPEGPRGRPVPMAAPVLTSLDGPEQPAAVLLICMTLLVPAAARLAPSSGAKLRPRAPAPLSLPG